MNLKLFTRFTHRNNIFEYSASFSIKLLYILLTRHYFVLAISASQNAALHMMLKKKRRVPCIKLTLANGFQRRWAGGGEVRGEKKAKSLPSGAGKSYAPKEK
jgi:hypothetical protein